MAKQKPSSESKAKEVTYVRLSPATIASLDEICASMPLKPKRAQLINMILEEYVERHGKSERRQKVGGL